MSNIPITKITIKRFRSIESAEIYCSQLTLFVGDNDAGKSNLLRALNLFFNGETDLGQKFDFVKDFCNFAQVSERKAKQLSIELTLQPPSSYSGGAQQIIWKKAWRKDGAQKNLESISFVDGSQFPQRSKLSSWLSRIKFKYVPAIRDKSYFSSLMHELHDSLSSTVAIDIKTAAVSFTKEINKHTKQIQSTISEDLGIASTLDLPNDLSEVFKALSFRSSESGIALDQRGDGVKVRHIPIILRFLANQDNHLRDSGSPKYTHIWGYEEPENNLEMKRAFDLSEAFLTYSNDIQILLTTHSPAFYGLAKKHANHTHAFFVESKNQVGTSYGLADLLFLTSVDELMGVMPLIYPHLEEAVTKARVLERKVHELESAATSNKKPRVYVEGPSDKAIIVAAIAKLYPNLSNEITVECSADSGGGANWVADMLIAHTHSRSSIKACGLFDRDLKGDREKGRYSSSPKSNNQSIVKAFSVPDSKHIKKLTKEYCFPVSIEEIFPANVWDHAEKSGWLEDRKDFAKLNLRLISNHQSIKQSLDETDLSVSDKRLLLYTIKNSEKKTFSTYVAKLGKTDNTVFEPLEQLLKRILAHLLDIDESSVS